MSGRVIDEMTRLKDYKESQTQNPNRRVTNQGK